VAKGRGSGPGKKPRKVRVDFRKNREKTAREKAHWTRHFRDDDVRHHDADKAQNVRAKGDLSRKRTIVIWDDTGENLNHREGVVVHMRGLIAEVDDGRQRWACTIRRVLRTRLIKERHPVTVGDRIRFSPVEAAGEQTTQLSQDEDLPAGTIHGVEERTTALLRQYDRRLQVVAANVDVALIVVAAQEPTLRPHLIDRYLVAVHQADMRPLICINKIDLDTAGEAETVAQRYRRIGYVALTTSVASGLGLDPLRELLREQTSVLVGPSGVGKSSLLNALDPALSLRIGSLTDLKRGRHTTTTASLLQWSFGGFVVDTPGMRQFDPADVGAEELEAYFAEFAGLIQGCRFPNCSHTHESHCAIKAAVTAGEISQERHDSYCKMYQECREKERAEHHSG
jgi:ribosome biogenesis GTPase